MVVDGAEGGDVGATGLVKLEEGGDGALAVGFLDAGVAVFWLIERFEYFVGAVAIHGDPDGFVRITCSHFVIVGGDSFFEVVVGAFGFQRHDHIAILVKCCSVEAFGAVLDWVVGGGAGGGGVGALYVLVVEVSLAEGDGHAVLAGFAEVAVAVAVVEAGAGGFVDFVTAVGGDAVEEVWPGGVFAEEAIIEEFFDGGFADVDVLLQPHH